MVKVALSYQRLLFQSWSASIENEDRFDLVVEKFADPREEKSQVGGLEGLS